MLFLGRGMFPKIGVPQNGWFIMENPIKMDDLGVALFLETPKCIEFLRISHRNYLVSKGTICKDWPNWNPQNNTFLQPKRGQFLPNETTLYSKATKNNPGFFYKGHYVTLTPTQTMQYSQGNPSKKYHQLLSPPNMSPSHLMIPPFYLAPACGHEKSFSVCPLQTSTKNGLITIICRPLKV